MVTAAAATLVFVFAVISDQLATIEAEDYSFGDIRLYLNGSSSLNNTRGVIEIFIDGEWGTVCIKKFNLASAAAACRQLGFINARDYDTPMEYHFQVRDDLEPVLTDVACNDDDIDDLATTGSLHILRCPNQVISNGSDTNSCSSQFSIVAVKCDTQELTNNPYKGQVRITDDSSVSSGIAEIYLHNQWGTICYDGMTQAAADSFCRQLGYTNSNMYMPIDGDLNTPMWVDRTHCSKSNQCFSTECISYPTSKDITCENITFIECIYDPIHDGLLSSGNIFECKIEPKSETFALVLGLSIGLSLLALCVIGIVGIVSIAACFIVSTCPLYAYRNKRKYTGLI